jgi:hypothetical protein
MLAAASRDNALDDRVGYRDAVEFHRSPCLLVGRIAGSVGGGIIRAATYAATLG